LLLGGQFGYWVRLTGAFVYALDDPPEFDLTEPTFQKMVRMRFDVPWPATRTGTNATHFAPTPPSTFSPTDCLRMTTWSASLPRPVTPMVH